MSAALVVCKWTLIHDDDDDEDQDLGPLVSTLETKTETFLQSKTPDGIAEKETRKLHSKSHVASLCFKAEGAARSNYVSRGQRWNRSQQRRKRVQGPQGTCSSHRKVTLGRRVLTGRSTE